jgi:hypothetical protein
MAAAPGALFSKPSGEVRSFGPLHRRFRRRPVQVTGARADRSHQHEGGLEHTSSQDSPVRRMNDSTLRRLAEMLRVQRTATIH